MDQQIGDMSALLEQKLGARGRTLEAQLRQAGRRLPRAMKRDANYLAQSVALMENPKLARMVNDTKFRKALTNVTSHLQSIDRSAQRRNAALNMAASIAFAILVTAVLVLIVLVQRGFV